MDNLFDDFPPVDEPLLRKLDEVYPESCADPASSEREIWMAVGARQVVRMLRAVYLEQQNED
jgi:hypothetical protein